MNVTVVKPSELSEELMQHWRQIQSACDDFHSPFFSPGFTQLIAQHRADVEVAVIRNGNQTVGFYPYQRGKHNQGHPVGWRLNDYQGLILQNGTNINFHELLSECRLTSMHFDHLLESQASMLECKIATSQSPFVDLRMGYDAYVSTRRATSRRFQSYFRKSRKIARELGELRFVFHEPTHDRFQQLMEWKGDHLAALGAHNVFQQSWAYQTARSVMLTNEPDFQGALSCLYAGDKLVAIHLGVRYQHVLHWWITTYNREVQKYSLGSALVLELIKSGPEHGIWKIDFGKGCEPYKMSFHNGVTTLCESEGTNSTWRRVARHFQISAKKIVRNTPLHGFVSAAKKRWNRRRQRGLTKGRRKECASNRD